MITQIAKHLQPLLLLRNAQGMAKFGNPTDKKKGQRTPIDKKKGQRTPLFSKKKEGQAASPQQTTVQQQSENNPFRFAGRQIPETDSSYKRRYPPKRNKLQDVQPERKQQKEAEQFIKSAEVHEISSSIFLSRQEANRIVEREEEYKQYKAASRFTMIRQKIVVKHQNTVLQNKILEEGNILLQKFKNKNWSELQQQLQQYQVLSSKNDVLECVHPLLAMHNTPAYINWLSSTDVKLEQLPSNLIQQILLSLLNSNHTKELLKCCEGLKKQSLPLNLHFLDQLFDNMWNLPIEVVLSSVPDRIKIASKLLYLVEEGEQQQRDKFYLGYWFKSFWQVAKINSQLLDHFIDFFQLLIIEHHNLIHFDEIHSNGLFCEVLEHYYYGSHINTLKLVSLLTHIVSSNYYCQALSNIKRSMILYSLRNDLVPFPNAKNLTSHLSQTLNAQQLERSLLFFVLCQYNQESNPYQIMRDNKPIFDIMKVDQIFSDILNDLLFCLPQSTLLEGREGIEEGEQGEEEVTNKLKALVQEKMADLKKKKKKKLIFKDNDHQEKQLKEFDDEDEYLASYLNNQNKQKKTRLEDQEQESEEYSSSVTLDPYVENMQFLHRGNLRLQVEKETNFFRKQLYKILITGEQVLDRVKAAIKLDKLELAFTMMKQLVMSEHIQERMTKNIDYAVKLYIQELYKDTKSYDLHQIADGITMKMIQALNYTDGDSSYFLQSIYQKLENFDHLIWNHLPDGQLKHQFWESTLILERARDVIQKDVSGELASMAYQPEIQAIPQRQVRQFNSNLDWRTELIYGLGIEQPEATPTDTTTSQWIEKDTYEEGKLNCVLPLFEENIVEKRNTRYFGGETVPLPAEEGAAEAEEEAAEQLQAAEEQNVQVEEGEAEVEEEAAEQLQAAAEEQNVQVQEGAELESAQHEEAKNQSEQNVEAVQQQQMEASQEQVEGESAVQQQQIEASQEQVEGESAVAEQTFQNIYKVSKDNNINGYDFDLFLQQSRNTFKPYFQQQYEQEKEFIRHMLALQAIAEQARIDNNQSLQKKFNEAEEAVKDPDFIRKLYYHGLYNYDFVTVQSPEEYITKADQFRQKFFMFKKYMGMKLPYEVPNLSKQHIFSMDDVIASRSITPEIVEELLVKRHSYFVEAEAAVKIEPVEEVDQLILWGVHNDQPMAVYLGQKLAMLTNQTISHPVALAVAKYLSHRRDVPQERIVRCKEALKIVGRINRQHIYELNKDYEHITVRKNFKRYVEQKGRELDYDGLSHLARVDPTHSVSKLGWGHAEGRAGITL